MPIIRQKFIYREDLQNNPGVIYVFGDNEMQFGYGGQAKEMRGEPNAFGIPTKESPSTYWSDDQYFEKIDLLYKSFEELKTLLNINRIVVYPSDGIGTGYAKMSEKCPDIFKYLNEQVDGLFKIYGVYEW